MIAVGTLGLLFAGLGTALFADLEAPVPATCVMESTSEPADAVHPRGWIGVMVENAPTPEGYVRIRRVYPGMPAWRAGLLSGDLITAVDGQPVAGRTVGEVAGTIRGELDTPVTLSIVRESCLGSHLEFRLVRQYWMELEHRGYWDEDRDSIRWRLDARPWSGQ